MKSGFLIAFKDLKILCREPWNLFWVIGFPLIFALFFGSIFSSAREGPQAGSLEIALVDDDQSELSKQIIEAINKESLLKIERLSLDEATNKVRTRKLAAFLHLKKGLGDPSLSLTENSYIAICADPSRNIDAGYLQGILVRKAVEILQPRIAEQDWLKKLGPKIREKVNELPQKDREVIGRFMMIFAQEIPKITPKIDLPKIEIVPITREEMVAPRSSFEYTFPQAVLWAVMSCAATFAVSLVMERVGGTLLRLRFAPVTSIIVIFGKSLACFIMSILVSILAMFLGIIAFGVKINNYAMLCLAIFCISFSFTGFMMTLANLGKTEQSVSGAGWGILSLLAMIGGGMVPLFIMPSWMQTLSNISPVKWGIVSLEGAIWRGYTFSEMLVPCSILIGIGIVFFAIGTKLFQRSEIV